MKKLNLIFTTLLLLFVSFSCSSDDEPQIEPPQPEKPKVEVTAKKLNAKWLLSDPRTKFTSFEFNESGSYIVEESVTVDGKESTRLHYGSYELVDNMIGLIDFANITVVELTDDELQFGMVMAKSTEKPLPFIAKRKVEMASTDRTDLLCRTWKVDKLNGLDVAGTEDESIMLFSKAGTYFVTTPDPEDGGLAQWRWKAGSDEKIMEYTWDKIFDGDESGEVTIEELTKDYLRVHEVFVDGEDEIDHLWELSPVQMTDNSTPKPKVVMANNKKGRKFIK